MEQVENKEIKIEEKNRINKTFKTRKNRRDNVWNSKKNLGETGIEILKKLFNEAWNEQKEYQKDWEIGIIIPLGI